MFLPSIENTHLRNKIKYQKKCLECKKTFTTMAGNRYHCNKCREGLDEKQKERTDKEW